MRPTCRLLAGLPALLLAACSSSDDPMSPDPGMGGPPVIADFSVSDADGIITHGDFTTLRWTTPGAAEISILPIVGQSLPPEGGAVLIRPFTRTTYFLTVRNSQGTASDSVTVDVRYRPGIYVSQTRGDDASSGQDINTPLATLGEALSRASGGGTIFLAAGTYTDPLAIDAALISVSGGLDPQTFFEGEPAGQYLTRVRPAAEVPLSIRNTTGIMELSRLRFESLTEATAGEVVDAQARLCGCTFDARSAAAPADSAGALRVVSTGPGARVEARGCRIFATRTISPVETRGVSVEQGPVAAPAELLLANCFVDGGKAIVRSSGVYIDSDGPVHLGLSTIGAETTSGGSDRDTPVAIRIVRGSPAIGGNILFTRGASVQRFGIQETSALGNPVSLEGNLFISVGGTPYDNYNGLDPISEAEMLDPQYTIDPNVTVGDNVLVTMISVIDILQSVPGQDFHLKPVAFGTPNPAQDRGSSWVVKAEYGAVDDDIDGDSRPGGDGSAWDLGADESN